MRLLHIPSPQKNPLDFAKMQQSEGSLHSNSDDVTTVGSGAADRRIQNGPSDTTSTEDSPFSHGFLDKDPESSKARSLYFKVAGGTVLIALTYVIWGVLSIYWASVFTLYSHAHNLHGWVVVST